MLPVIEVYGPNRETFRSRTLNRLLQELPSNCKITFHGPRDTSHGPAHLYLFFLGINDRLALFELAIKLARVMPSQVVITTGPLPLWSEAERQQLDKLKASQPKVRINPGGEPSLWPRTLDWAIEYLHQLSERIDASYRQAAPIGFAVHTAKTGGSGPFRPTKPTDQLIEPEESGEKKDE